MTQYEYGTLEYATTVVDDLSGRSARVGAWVRTGQAKDRVYRIALCDPPSMLDAMNVAGVDGWLITEQRVWQASNDYLDRTVPPILATSLPDLEDRVRDDFAIHSAAKLRVIFIFLAVMRREIAVR